jgi:hypothetical protein
MRRVRLPFAIALVLSLVAFPVAAAKPEIISEQVDEVFFDDELADVCGFDVWVTLKGHTKTRFMTDRHGNLARIVFTILLRGTVSAGGTTLRFTDAGSDMIIPLDGGGERVAVRGSLSLITAPGYGPVLNAAGRFVFEVTPVLDESGNPVLDENGNPIMNFEILADSGIRVENLEAVCASLDPAG